MLIYSIPLQTVALLLGIALIAFHLLPLIKPFYFQDLLQKFPRSPIAGYTLIVIATLWATSLLTFIDLGEYNKLRTTFVLLTLTGGVLCCFYVVDFLSLRGLGMILLLGANVLLDACFMQNNPWKIALVIQAYVWIILGIILVSSPYLIRNAIQWSTASLTRWQWLMSLGVLWGFFILGLALFSL